MWWDIPFLQSYTAERIDLDYFGEE